MIDAALAVGQEQVMSEYKLKILSLGSSADGVARIGDARVHVPFALPGEEVVATGSPNALRLKHVVAPSPERVAPACRHFGQCGGCSLQHLAAEPYLVFKRELVAHALAARGLDAEVVAPCRSEPPGGRRRATFKAARRGKQVLLGFNKRKSHDIVDIAECPVVDPSIAAALPGLRKLADEILPAKGEMSLLLTRADNGLDLYIDETPKGFVDRDAMRASAAGLEAGFIRVGIKGFDALTREAPIVAMGEARLVPPVGGFLQATPTGETTLAELVMAHVSGARRVADLFAGSGTFALRLAARASVTAVEGHAPAIAALSAAARAATGRINPIIAETRDLFRRPLLAHELERFDAVVLDPPRSGAAAQVAELAKSKAVRIAYVSCNPGPLARDLKTLVDGGYTLQRVTPVDQFIWSAHVEAVAELTRSP